MFFPSTFVEISFWLVFFFLWVYQDQGFFTTANHHSPRKTLFKGDKHLLKYMAWFSVVIDASVLFAHIEMFYLGVSGEIQMRALMEIDLPWFIPQLLIVGASWLNHRYRFRKH